ncbi:hypothetical protein [Pueribacillus sp. YX66]|uniref:hypothetical protein n=1 Tax=Pueribacillus sp. YX66 TaxID=3229242 RepID=UPI00358D3AD3
MDDQYSIFQSWIDNDTLLCVDVLLHKVGKKTVFGRLLRVDENEHSLLLYDVDKKQVLSLDWNEIDQLEPAK